MELIAIKYMMFLDAGKEDFFVWGWRVAGDSGVFQGILLLVFFVVGIFGGWFGVFLEERLTRRGKKHIGKGRSKMVEDEKCKSGK